MCHSRHARHARHHHRSAREPRAAPPAPDRPTGPTRAGDADRDRAAEKLRVHAGAGRLDADELERRLETVLTATYLSDLEPALADLPRLRSGERPRSARPRRRPLRTARAIPRVAILLAAVAALLLVTMLTGLWALWWLMWPIAMLTHPRGHGHRHGRAASRAAPV
jgi:hypothetical protein